MFSIFKKSKKENTVETKSTELKAFLSGQAVPITEVPDELFSSKVLGDGMAIFPKSEILKAPCDATVSVVMEGSFHACGLTLANGMELLLHIGINTVEMNGDGFTSKVKCGDKVKAGQDLITFDIKKIEAAGYSTATMLIVTNPGKVNNIQFLTNQPTTAGETVIATFE